MNLSGPSKCDPIEKLGNYQPEITAFSIFAGDYVGHDDRGISLERNIEIW